VRTVVFFLTVLLATGHAALTPICSGAAAQQETPPSRAATFAASKKPVIVLDPAHGGADPGARGEGLLEKDIVLEMARSVRAELERQGYRVVLTRNDDSNPSYDERAAIANAYRDSIFITLHISSTGQPGTARAYFDQVAAAAPPAPVGAAPNAASPTPPPGLLPWDQAQQPQSDASRHLANAIQAHLAQLFPGSPGAAAPAAVRGLRSVAAPAAAIEIASVSVSKPEALTALAAPLATVLARGIAAFQALDPNGAK